MGPKELIFEDRLFTSLTIDELFFFGQKNSYFAVN